MRLKIPVIGGVRDGDIVTIPSNASPGFQVVLEQSTSKPAPGDAPETSSYTFLEDLTALPPRALVLDGMRWPILALDGSAA